MARKWICAILSLALIALLPAAAMAEASAEPVTLKFLMFDGEGEGPGFEARTQCLDELFFPEHPNVTIEYEYIPFNDMEKKAITAFAGGVSYDLMIVNHPAVAQYQQAGMLLPLNDYLKAAGIDFTSYYSASIANCGVFDDVVYSIPRDTDTRVLAVNKKLFEEAGIAYPTTTTEMLDAAKGLTKDTDGDGVNDQFGFIFEASNAYHPTYELGQFLLGNGVKVFNVDADGKYFSQLDTQGAKDFMDFSIELAKCNPNDFISYDGDKIRSLFCQGKLGMFVFGSWNLTNAEIKKAVDDGTLTYDLITNPAGTDHSGASQGGYHYAIGSKTEHPDEAWAVLEVLNRPESAAKICYGCGGLPTVMEAYNFEPFNKPLYEVIAKQLKTAEVPVPQISVTNQIVTEIWYNAWLSAVLGEATPEDALAGAHEEINSVLAEYMGS